MGTPLSFRVESREQQTSGSLLFVRALMRAFICRTLRMLSFLPQVIGLTWRHLASIDESIHA